MRFLLFETFRHPSATVTARITEDVLRALALERTKLLQLAFELKLKGIKRILLVDTVLKMLADERVSIASTAPVDIDVAPFGLLEGIRKLEEAAGVKIVPRGSVSFDLMFQRTDSRIESISADAEQLTQSS